MIGLHLVWLSIVVIGLQVVDAAEPAASGTAATTGSAPEDATLTIVDEAGTAHAISRADFSQLPRRAAKVATHGADAEFEGVSLVELLESCGVKFGDALRGRRAPTVAVLEATDGYRVAISLLEIDPKTNDRLALVADRRDGKPLDAHQGPFRLVVPGDKREIRWIRNVKSVRVTNLIDLPLHDSPASSTNASPQ